MAITKPQTTIHNAQTGEVITREMTSDELAQREADKTISDAVKAAAAKAEADKAALLAQLGITEEQAKLLLS
jgi:hypothetical protein